MSDFWTMVWKETRDSIFSDRWSGRIMPLIILAAMGFFMPWQFGRGWISLSVGPVFVICYIPFFLTTSYIGDAVAGERERHTLETLLASRISVRAILWGKIAVAIAYVWGLTLISLTTGLVVANLSSGQARWEFYHPIDIFLEVLLLSLLAALLSAGGGVLISLRAATVRQAQQTMAISTLALLIAIVLILRSVPSGVLAGLDASRLLLFFIGGFALLDLLLIGILSAGFRRSRLILS